MCDQEDFNRAYSLGNLKIGQVIPKTNKINYNLTKFQTMKNYKLAQWVLTAGETHVSLGCVDFAQLLFGTFDGDLTKKIQFYGISSLIYVIYLVPLMLIVMSMKKFTYLLL